MKVGNWVCGLNLVGKVILTLPELSVVLVDYCRDGNKDLQLIEKDSVLAQVKPNILRDLKKKYLTSYERFYTTVTPDKLGSLRYKPGDRFIHKSIPNATFTILKYYSSDAVIAVLDAEADVMNTGSFFKITETYCNRWNLDHSFIGRSERDTLLSSIVSLVQKSKCVDCKGDV